MTRLEVKMVVRGQGTSAALLERPRHPKAVLCAEPVWICFVEEVISNKVLVGNFCMQHEEDSNTER